MRACLDSRTVLLKSANILRVDFAVILVMFVSVPAFCDKYFRIYDLYFDPVSWCVYVLQEFLSGVLTYMLTPLTVSG